MMIADAMSLLVEATLASLLALALVMTVRTSVRRCFGAEAAYAVWLLVPMALFAVSLPAAGPDSQAALWRDMTRQALPIITAPGVGAAGSMSSVLFGLWCAGALATAFGLVLRQHQFMLGLGPLRRRPDGYLQSVATRGLPAVVGLRPRIVLPGDFETRYSAAEQDLVLAHEHVHLRRGDVLLNFLAGVVRSLLWFNPLVHAAIACFRHDQELSCDAAVLRRHPERRRTYGDAMLKTELSDWPLPVGCHWSGIHPLKERVIMLKNPPISPRRRLAGLTFAAGFAVAVSSVGWATQPTTGAKDNGMADSGIQGQAPAYPKAAAEAGQGGLVMLRVLVGVDGKAREVNVDAEKSTVPADSELAENARAAAIQWDFNPAVRDGKAVPGWVMVPVRFEPPTEKAVGKDA